MRRSGELLANEPCRSWRLLVTIVSPAAHSMGTAPSIRSEPLSATSFLISALPSRWLPGSTQTPFPAVLGCSWVMKLKPCAPMSQSGAVPVGRAVLVPGHRRAEARLLDEGHLVVGHEIIAEDRRRHRQQPGMAVEPQRRIHQVQVAVEQFHGPGGTALAQRRLEHLQRDGARCSCPCRRPGRSTAWRSGKAA